MATETVNQACAAAPMFYPPARFAMDMQAPYGVYENGVLVAEHDTEDDAEQHFKRLRYAAMTPQQRQRERDRLRTVLQQPISTPRYRVMYLVNGRERKSAWLYNSDHAQRGLRMMQSKYGERNAIIYVD